MVRPNTPNLITITAAATAGALFLSGCGESEEASRQALDSLVTEAGYEILEYGQNPYGAMHFNTVAVGSNCVAEVWTATNDAIFDYFDGQAPVEMQVYTNDDIESRPFKIYESADEDFLSLEELLARPLIARVCAPEVSE